MQTLSKNRGTVSVKHIFSSAVCLLDERDREGDITGGGQDFSSKGAVV